MRIAFLGAGAWGTALAQHAAQAHPVCLWARDPSVAHGIAASHENARYLPGVRLRDAVHARSSLADTLDWLGEADDGLLVVSTSMAGLAPTVRAVAALRERPRFVWLCKGIERGTGALPHEVVAAAAPGATAGALSGPSFAQEVAAGLPAALTVAASDATIADACVRAFHLGSTRIYRSNDLLGVELGGALKNIVAIATGICDGLALGLNARAALITRGLAEMTRLGVAMGARAETFMGLTGLGDLVLTCTGDLSRNRRVGLELAAGRSLEQVLAGLGHVAEGVACVDAALVLAARHGVELPIAAAVASVLRGERTAREAVGALLAREPKREH
jgi:glycerol-3-phosphate dehydrogenase (NAD(P)+)